MFDHLGVDGDSAMAGQGEIKVAYITFLSMEDANYIIKAYNK